MTRYTLRIDGEPFGKQEKRVVWGGQHTYMPDKTAGYMDDIKWLWRQKYPGFQPIHEAVWLRIDAWCTVPKSITDPITGKRHKVTKPMKQNMLSHKELPRRKPDCSNIAKIVEDGLTGALYVDDCQITHLEVFKHYTELDSHVYVTVETL